MNPYKTKSKSRIASHANNISMLLLVLVLALMAVLSAVIIDGTNKGNARDLVQAYSIEAAQAFYSSISQDLTLVRKASHSNAIASWFADEGNEAKKALAYDEMMVYAEILQGAHLFFGIHQSKNEYSIPGLIDREGFVPFDQLNPSSSDDKWYYECMESENEYALNNDIEKLTDTWRLWINHKVLIGGKPVGVFCSGLRIPDLYEKVFHNYKAARIKGYIINKNGIIQSESTYYGIFSEAKSHHILEENTDPEFTSELNSYLGSIDGLFDDLGGPEIVKLKRGRYEYMAVSPISYTDWSVVILYYGSPFTGIVNYLPLAIVMLLALFIYVLGRSALMKKLVYTPLNRLTQDISDSKSEKNDFFGSNRDDEIGDLARAIRDATREQQRQKLLLHAVNSAAAVLLFAEYEENIHSYLIESMDTIGLCIDVDRIHIWRNETINGIFYYVSQIQWLKEGGLWKKPAPAMRAYSENPEWEKRFLNNEYVNGPISNLTQSEQDILAPQGVKSILAIPLYMKEQFYGFLSFDDCHRERTFLEDEVEILRSVGLMIVSAMNRNAQAKQLRQAHERSQILLDAMPLSCQLWNRAGELFGCNEEAVKLFKTKDKQDFIDHIWDCSPEYQDDGQLSVEKAFNYLRKAFDEGRCSFEWMHQMSTGRLVPAEVTLVRLKFGDEDIVAAYARDLREYKKMMQDIERRDYLLNVANNAATIMLQSDTGSFTKDLYHCIGMMAEAVDVQSVSIWKNSIVDNELYCHLVYRWVGSKEVHKDILITEDVPYKKNVPEWEKILSKGDCINSIVRDRPAAEQDHLAPQGIKTIFILPVFVQDQFWGFVGYYDYLTEKPFSENEQTFLCSGGIVIANALLRNEMTRNIHDSADKLKAALQEAQNANNAKSNFLARMSHEMRTPLNAIIGLSELSLGSGELDLESSSNLEKINNAGMTLLSTVNHILDISKIEAGKFELLPVEYDLPSLLNDAITQCVMHIEEKPIVFLQNIDKKLPTRLYGDDLRIKQILNNLLSNAFKYTREGSVELGVKRSLDEAGFTPGEKGFVWITITVSDTGIGIRNEDLPDLFTDYAQMDIEFNRKIEGTGLGLPITQKIVEMMGGSISVESEYGKGSVFTVKLRQKIVTDTEIGMKVVDSLKNSRYSDQKRRRSSRMMRVRLPYARVLVVDDVVVNLDVTKGMMKPYGMQVDCVTSGREAIEAIRSEKVRYNAIFMDHMMPGMDGIEAAKIIRKEIGTEYSRNIPIIALTANAIVGNEKMFLDSGFQAFISKPIEIERLDAVIREFVRDKEIEKTLDKINIRGEMLPDVRNGKERRESFDRRSGIDRRISGITVNGLDMEKGIQRFGGNEESYLQVLRSFASNTRPLLDAVRNPVKEDIASYAITLHGIKGACRGICAELLGAKAEGLEKAAKDGNMDYLAANNSSFVEAAEILLGDLEEMLKSIVLENPKPIRQMPDTEVLKKLLAACRRYDMDGADAAMAEIESYDYDADDGLAAWLRENVDQVNFTQIKDRLKFLDEGTM